MKYKDGTKIQVGDTVTPAHRHKVVKVNRGNQTVTMMAPTGFDSYAIRVDAFRHGSWVQIIEKTTDHAPASEVCGVHGGKPRILAAFLIGVVVILVGLIAGICLLLK